MPPRVRYVPLQPVAPDRMSDLAGLPSAREHKAKFPKRAADRSAARSALKRWAQEQPEPAAPRNPDVPIQAVKVTVASLTKLRTVVESDVAPTEMLEQRMSPDDLFGALYSANSAYEFMKLQSEYKRRKASGRGSDKVEEQWRDVVKAAQTAYAAAGRPNVTEADLNGYVRELTKNRANLNAVTRLSNEAVALDSASTLTAGTKLVASFLPDVRKVIDLSDIITPIRDLCDDPIAQGSFTKHFSYSVSLSVTIKYWCPTWTNPFRTCTKKVTLAGVSFSVAVSVGYRVNCCGATVWGQGQVQACATIIGIKVCATCTATITGVAGISRTPVGSGCNYGLGISATLQCKLAGQTILNISYPFGWVVSGPCPPAGLCP